MTKVKKPLFSLGTKGKLGPLVISRLLGGSHKVAVKRPPANPRSPAQLEQRANYSAALEVWRTLTPAQKHEYYLMDPQIGAAPAYLNFMKEFLLSVPDQLDTLIARLNSLITLMAAGLPASLIADSLKTREQNPLSGFATSGKQDTLIGHVDGLETLLGAGLPAALDTLALKVKEQSPISGFATSAKQDTQITALQLIDDLRTALASVATDKLRTDIITAPTLTVQAAGNDKIFSFESVVTVNLGLTATATTEQFNGTAVPAGKIWVITYISSIEANHAPTLMRFRLKHNNETLDIADEIRALVAGTCYALFGQFYLDAGDYMAVYLRGIQVGDIIYLRYAGYQMDAP